MLCDVHFVLCLSDRPKRDAMLLESTTTSISADATFGDRVLEFYRTVQRPAMGSAQVEWIDPYDKPEVRRSMDAFYGAFYNDHRQRLFLLGINPGRFGAGVTGIPFTDGYQLAASCGIPNSLPQRQELSANFIHQVVQEWGGADAFFRQIYITAVCPLGLLRNGLNFNYYDDRPLMTELEPFLVETLRHQIAIGARTQSAVVIGTGKNFQAMQRLNDRYHLFETLSAVEHPRFIMQYRRKQVDRYVSDYLRVLGESLA